MKLGAEFALGIKRAKAGKCRFGFVHISDFFMRRRQSQPERCPGRRQIRGLFEEFRGGGVIPLGGGRAGVKVAAVGGEIS